MINCRPGQQQQQQESAPSVKAAKKPPRKLEMRLPNNGASPTNVTFSAPFLDNTLSKLLTLQNRMLKVSNDIAASEDVDEAGAVCTECRVVEDYCTDLLREGETGCLKL
jgi:hypothetical protein